MTIDTTRWPTHLALVARRYNVCSPDDLAGCFLETSYIAEAFLKTLGAVLQAGFAAPAREISYRQAYELVRADGLGSWERAVRDMTAQPTAAYLPPAFFPLLAWVSKKRTKPEDEWVRNAHSHAQSVLGLLGVEGGSGQSISVKELISCLVQIRNKTKAHGAVGDEFYNAANRHYFESIVHLVSNSPICDWTWFHLTLRESGKVRAIDLAGTNPKHLREVDAAKYMPEQAGIYFLPTQSGRIFYSGSLVKSNRECTSFFLPNGGFNPDGTCEYIDYGSGRTCRESAKEFLAPPAALPPSDTEGLGEFDIQSNTFGNLPSFTIPYVKRNTLESELRARLLDKNHTVITLHGGGGMGKTSLALAVVSDLSKMSEPPFEHLVWLSARDVDLRPTGPSSVQPTVFDLTSVSRRFGKLFSEWGGSGDSDALARALEKPSAVSSKGVLFIFDNFETLSDVRGLHKFLDEHTHLPNKVLITSRDRAFVADYPIEVRGMELAEAEQLMIEAARSLSIEGLMTKDVMWRIYEFTGGHAYVMRVIVGEMAKDGRYVPAAQVMGRRQDIVEAVFERSFNKLSDSGRNVFLLVANWRSNVPEIGLIVILGVRGFDALAGIEECRRLSLIFPIEVSGDQIFYSVPQLARTFAHKKLQGDPDRLVIRQDLDTLHRFGTTAKTSLGNDAETRLIEQFCGECLADAYGDTGTVSRTDRLLEALANSWPPGWLKLAEFRQKSGAHSDEVQYALRRAVEEEPFSKSAWLERARYATQLGDDAVRIASLVSAVEADNSDVGLMKEVAFQLARYINNHLAEIPKTRRGVYVASVRTNMERMANKLDADGLSRLAWLFLFEENIGKAREYATRGCSLDSRNVHCLKILERLEGQPEARTID